MKSGRNSVSTPQRSPATKPRTSSVSKMLTPSEIEQVKRKDREASAYARKVFKKKA